MSWYATSNVLMVEHPNTDEWVQVLVQGVPGHIQDEVDWLPPPVNDEDQLRAVVFIRANEPMVDDGSHGQRYHLPLLVLTGEQYKRAGFAEVLAALAASVRAGGLRQEQVVEMLRGKWKLHRIQQTMAAMGAAMDRIQTKAQETLSKEAAE